MSEKTLNLTLGDVKEAFCVAEKEEALKSFRRQLDDVWDIDKAEELLCAIGEKMDAQIKAEGLTWTTWDRLLWVVKEAFVLGSLDMAERMMIVNDMSYADLAGEGTQNEDHD